METIREARLEREAADRYPSSPFGCGPKPHAWLTWCGSI